ncbi:MAG TPA: zf-HC2 domain-containing protein, partial [Vicinamibacterales bacterium]
MENPRTRDDAIERLLRGPDGPFGGTATGTCVAPEEMAAWLEGGLSAAEAVRLETHTASCPECRALVAAFAQTLPPAQGHAWTRMGWVAPMAAAAVLVLGVWLTRPDQGARPSAPTEGRVARLEQPPVTVPTAPVAPDPEERAIGRSDLSRQALPAPPSANDVSAPSPAAAPAAPPPAPTVATPAAEPASSAEQKAERRETQAEGLASAAPTRVAEADRTGTTFRARVAELAPTVVSPSGRTRCRVRGGSAVEASSDGGATWAAVGGTTPAVAGAVLGGASPSDGVCWMVGRGGVVILVRDGRATLSGPPEAGDLRTVQAEDADTALVRAADGRAWRTSDGGRTWSVVQAGR